MKKGSFGYLKKAGKLSLIKSALMLAAILIVFFAALHHFQTNKNVFSILCAVSAIPTGRSVVETIMFLRAKSASGKVREAVEGLKGLPAGASGYDLYLTAYERSYSLSHAAVLDGTVVGLTEDEKTDCSLCRRHLLDMLKKDNHPGYDVHIYRDLDKYMEELNRLCASADREENPDYIKEDREVMQMILGISI